jgi:hypothetical protein
MTSDQLTQEFLDRLVAEAGEVRRAPASDVVAEILRAIDEVRAALDADGPPGGVGLARARDWAIRGAACFVEIAVRLAVAEDVRPADGGGP